MKRFMLAVLCFVGLNSLAYAEKIQCVDKQHMPHSVEFIGNILDYVYVDKLQYDFVGQSKDGKIVKYADDKHDITFLVDPNNRDWFIVAKSTKATKTKKGVEQYLALCDNVHVAVEEKQPQLISYK